ncbi:MAG: macro domain-containing protein [Ignavibacteriaceae bacterium]|nr:macro domain-containing protein [Ignavibacterium sp.]MCC6253757.1 macro domain-containing protein [Ignavibacteriaceae bacterium]HRN27489.1 macro domain-containing protein [Ignavibacteriaceae bacterium]HRP91679.1 macro domain-containing protein [Ignavibacteriaceae bacterium]HRQ55569.1 macro domain-containing protein [Ignavibacteriaceae bacterium]
MIDIIKKGNLLDADVEAVVNTVNTEGVMGAGVALQFKKAFPDNFKLYEKAAKVGQINVGKIFVTETGKITNPKYIINFPTKQHWRYPSKLVWIKDGLEDLKKFIIKKKIKSIALPPLGCGNGKLNWNDVKPLIINSLEDISNLQVQLFEPSDYAYHTASKKSFTKMPQLTSTRSMIIALLQRYRILGYELTLLEAQKLVYFLERFGEPLKMQFTKGTYGPFSEVLTHVLSDLDGHYIAGMKQKTAKPFDKIIINKNELPKVYDFIVQNCTQEQKDRLDKVYKLIEGFESPLSMELLATVDYVLKYELKQGLFAELELENKIHSWNERKRKLLSKEYIDIALEKLRSFEQTLYS